MEGPDPAVRQLTRIIVVIAFLALASCQYRHPGIFQPIPAAQWQEIFRERRENTASIRAEARIQMTAGEGIYPGRMNLVWKGPGKMRADFFDPFGRVMGMLAISGRNVVDYFPEKTFGESNFGELARITGITNDSNRLPAEEISSLITGLPGVFRESSHYSWSETAQTAGESSNTVTANGPAIVLSLYKGAPVIGKIILCGTPAGSTLVIKYEQYRMVDEMPLPGKVSITDAEHDWSLDLMYRNIERNVEVDDELFSIEGSKKP